MLWRSRKFTHCSSCGCAPAHPAAASEPPSDCLVQPIRQERATPGPRNGARRRGRRPARHRRRGRRGTLSEVLSGLHKDATLGILPLGTAKVLARELGLPLKPEDAYLKDPNYGTLRLRLEAAHSVVEAAVEARWRLRLNEG